MTHPKGGSKPRKRNGLSNKVRFGVFKRDSLVCQYLLKMAHSVGADPEDLLGQGSPGGAAHA